MHTPVRHASPRGGKDGGPGDAIIAHVSRRILRRCREEHTPGWELDLFQDLDDNTNAVDKYPIMQEVTWGLSPRKALDQNYNMVSYESTNESIILSKVLSKVRTKQRYTSRLVYQYCAQVQVSIKGGLRRIGCCVCGRK